jgi:Protein of unknown function (DUF3093)
MVLFEQRQWASRRILIQGVSFGIVIGLIACGISARLGIAHVWTSIFPWFVGAGLGTAALIWIGQVLMRMQVQQSGLQMGRVWIPYSAIESARFLDAAEAKRVMLLIGGRAQRRGFPLTRKEWRRIHGNWWQPWMGEAIYLQIKPGSDVITDKWLIGSHRLDEVMRLIQEGMVRAHAAPDAATAPAAV